MDTLGDPTAGEQLGDVRLLLRQGEHLLRRGTRRGLHRAAQLAAHLHGDGHLLHGDERRRLATVVTNADGRSDAPLLAGESLPTGIYELTFRTVDYFRLGSVTLTTPPFFGDIVIRFGIGNPTANYHVPLLLSPYGYTTYRGS